MVPFWRYVMISARTASMRDARPSLSVIRVREQIEEVLGLLFEAVAIEREVDRSVLGLDIRIGQRSDEPSLGLRCHPLELGEDQRDDRVGQRRAWVGQCRRSARCQIVEDITDDGRADGPLSVDLLPDDGKLLVGGIERVTERVIGRKPGRRVVLVRIRSEKRGPDDPVLEERGGPATPESVLSVTKPAPSEYSPTTVI
jgi:hypothetical protein